MRAALRRLLDRLGVPGSVEPEVVVLLPEPLAGQVRALLAAGRRTDAVRLTRRRTRIDLLPAVRAVDALASRPPAGDPPLQRGPSEP